MHGWGVSHSMDETINQNQLCEKAGQQGKAGRCWIRIYKSNDAGFGVTMRYATISTATSNLQAWSVKDVASLYSQETARRKGRKMCGSVAYRLALFFFT